MQDHDKQAAEQSVAALTTEITSAYVSNNTIAPGDIGRLIADIGRLLPSLGEPPEPNQEKPEPALALLAPEIVESILTGSTDQALMLGRLERPLPASWEKQSSRALTRDL